MKYKEGSSWVHLQCHWSAAQHRTSQSSTCQPVNTWHFELQTTHGCVPPETVCLMKPAKQWIQCKICPAVGHGSCGGGAGPKPIKKEEFSRADTLFTINVPPWIQHWFDTYNSNLFVGRTAVWIFSIVKHTLSFFLQLRTEQRCWLFQQSWILLLPLNPTVFLLKD